VLLLIIPFLFEHGHMLPPFNLNYFVLSSSSMGPLCRHWYQIHLLPRVLFSYWTIFPVLFYTGQTCISPHVPSLCFRAWSHATSFQSEPLCALFFFHGTSLSLHPLLFAQTPVPNSLASMCPVFLLDDLSGFILHRPDMYRV
jgi:hypothetical protein